jgi:hypothetical protein
MKVVVYIRASDERELRESEEDPASWVRQVVKNAIELRRELVRRQATRTSH